jgi:hypothetical protein
METLCRTTDTVKSHFAHEARRPAWSVGKVCPAVSGPGLGLIRTEEDESAGDFPYRLRAPVQ